MSGTVVPAFLKSAENCSSAVSISSVAHAFFLSNIQEATALRRVVAAQGCGEDLLPQSQRAGFYSAAGYSELGSASGVRLPTSIILKLTLFSVRPLV
jgi:hypothetical protein